MFLERRKGFGEATMDRRKTYVDVMERVLGNSLPTDFPPDPGSFTIAAARESTIGSTVCEIQVTVLDSMDDRRRR